MIVWWLSVTPSVVDFTAILTVAPLALEVLHRMGKAMVYCCFSDPAPTRKHRCVSTVWHLFIIKKPQCPASVSYTPLPTLETPKSLLRSSRTGLSHFSRSLSPPTLSVLVCSSYFGPNSCSRLIQLYIALVAYRIWYVKFSRTYEHN